MPEIITSLQNSRVKQVVRLRKHSERESQNLFIIEGFREIQMALKFDYSVQTIFFCNSFLKNFTKENFFKSLPDSIQLVEVSEAVFEKIAYREHSDGLLAVGIPRFEKIGNLNITGDLLLIVLETVEKPGNLGAILRTADAASVDAVIICDPKTDIFNPNVIRSSLGCIFSNRVVVCTSEEAEAFFKKNGIKTFAACLQTEELYHKAEFNNSSAIVMGAEATGLSDFWLTRCDHRIKIPMSGFVDSLNVSVSTAIIVFEALRQRNFNKKQKNNQML